MENPMVTIYYKLVKANMSDPTKGKTIDQVPENLRAEVQAKLDADAAQTVAP